MGCYQKTSIPGVGEYVVAASPLGTKCPAGALGVVLRHSSGESGPFPITCLFNGCIRAHIMEDAARQALMGLGEIDNTAKYYRWRGPVTLEEDVKRGMFVQTFAKGRILYPGLVGQVNPHRLH